MARGHTGMRRWLLRVRKWLFGSIEPTNHCGIEPNLKSLIRLLHLNWALVRGAQRLGSGERSGGVWVQATHTQVVPH